MIDIHCLILPQIDNGASSWEVAEQMCAMGCAHWRARPGFSVTAILVTALGIGATTPLFTIVRSVLLKPLPFRDPDKLVMLYEHFRQDPNYPYNVAAPADFHDWREQTKGFEDIAAWHWWGCNVTGDNGELPEVVGADAGSWNFFSVLGVNPVLGRSFTAD
jgi:hypothetical protein